MRGRDSPVGFFLMGRSILHDNALAGYSHPLPPTIRFYTEIWRNRTDDRAARGTDEATQPISVEERSNEQTSVNRGQRRTYLARVPRIMRMNVPERILVTSINCIQTCSRCAASLAPVCTTSRPFPTPDSPLPHSRLPSSPLPSSLFASAFSRSLLLIGRQRGRARRQAADKMPARLPIPDRRQDIVLILVLVLNERRRNDPTGQLVDFFPQRRVLNPQVCVLGLDLAKERDIVFRATDLPSKAVRIRRIRARLESVALPVRVLPGGAR